MVSVNVYIGSTGRREGGRDADGEQHQCQNQSRENGKSSSATSMDIGRGRGQEVDRGSSEKRRLTEQE